jgi:hypothetical protein
MAVRAAHERTFCRTREPAGVLEVLAWSPAVQKAAGLLSRSCRNRREQDPSAICQRAIPRLHHRLTALGMPAAASNLETGIHHWIRMVKRALALRTADLPADRDCPLGR